MEVSQTFVNACLNMGKHLVDKSKPLFEIFYFILFNVHQFVFKLFVILFRYKTDFFFFFYCF